MNRIPKHKPEDLNLLSVLERLSDVERLIKVHGNTLEGHSSGIANINRLLSEKPSNTDNNRNASEKRYSALAIEPTYSSGTNLAQDNNSLEANSSDVNIQSVINERDHDSEVTEDEMQDFMDDLDRRTSVLSHQPIYPTLKPLDEENILNTSCCESADDEHKYSDVVKNKPRRQDKTSFQQTRYFQQSKTTGDERKRVDQDHFRPVESPRSRRRRLAAARPAKEGLCGAPTSGLVGATISSDVDVWIGRIEKGSAAVVSRYLNSHGIKPGFIRKTSHENASYFSYRFSLSNKDSKKVLKEGFWPDGVVSRIWRAKPVFKE